MKVEFLKRRYMGQEALNRSLKKDEVEREKEADMDVLVTTEKSVLQQLPIYNSVKSLTPARDSLMMKNPVPKSTNSNLPS